MGDYYSLKKELKQHEFHKCILAARNMSFNYRFDLYLDELGIEDADGIEGDLYRELDEVRELESAYAEIGFLYMHDMEVKSLDIIGRLNNVGETKKYIKISLYKDVIWIDGTLEDLRLLCRYLDLDMLIGDIIKANK
jgi:hypothetical protein